MARAKRARVRCYLELHGKILKSRSWAERRRAMQAVRREGMTGVRVVTFREVRP